jgi:hypothetical protein
MSTRQPADVPVALSITRRQFEQWRRRQHGRKRLPKELWETAVALAREHGINQTARTFRREWLNRRAICRMLIPSRCAIRILQ